MNETGVISWLEKVHGRGIAVAYYFVAKDRRIAAAMSKLRAKQLIHLPSTIRLGGIRHTGFKSSCHGMHAPMESF